MWHMAQELGQDLLGDHQADDTTSFSEMISDGPKRGKVAHAPARTYMHAYS